MFFFFKYLILDVHKKKWTHLVKLVVLTCSHFFFFFFIHSSIIWFVYLWKVTNVTLIDFDAGSDSISIVSHFKPLLEVIVLSIIIPLSLYIFKGNANKSLLNGGFFVPTCSDPSASR